MPKGIYDRAKAKRRTHPTGFRHGTFTGRGPWENVDRAPYEDVPDLRRGELRLAAEVALAILTFGNGDFVDNVALVRANNILQRVASE